LSLIVWQSAHETPTLSPAAMLILPSPLLSFGTMPTTAFASISFTVVAGSFISGALAADKSVFSSLASASLRPAGTASASTSSRDLQRVQRGDLGVLHALGHPHRVGPEPLVAERLEPEHVPPGRGAAGAVRGGLGGGMGFGRAGSSRRCGTGGFIARGARRTR
jgi:hypothetical protein